jgi:hypothetical protein
MTSVDWTGDGVPELAIDPQNWPFPYEGGGAKAKIETLGIWLYRFDGSVVAPYVPPLPAPFSPTALRDIDHDGLPDLLDGKRWHWSETSEDFEHLESLAIVAHALGRGKFTFDDAATRAYYAAACKDAHAPWTAPLAGAAAKNETPYDVELAAKKAVARRLACACELGIDLQEVRAALDKELEATGMKDAQDRAWYPFPFGVGGWKGCDRLSHGPR